MTTTHLDRDKLKTYDRRTRKCAFFRVGAASIRLIQFALASSSRTKPLPSCLQLFSLTASSALISVWIRRWYTRRIACAHPPTASWRETSFAQLFQVLHRGISRDEPACVVPCHRLRRRKALHGMEGDDFQQRAHLSPGHVPPAWSTAEPLAGIFAICRSRRCGL